MIFFLNRLISIKETSIRKNCIPNRSPKSMKKLKADRPHPRNYPQTPTDYKHTDNHLRLVMVVLVLYCTRQSRALTNTQTNKHTGRQTDGWTLSCTLSPCFAVDNDVFLDCKCAVEAYDAFQMMSWLMTICRHPSD